MNDTTYVPYEVWNQVLWSCTWIGMPTTLRKKRLSSYVLNLPIREYLAASAAARGSADT